MTEHLTRAERVFVPLILLGVIVALILIPAAAFTLYQDLSAFRNCTIHYQP